MNRRDAASACTRMAFWIAFFAVLAVFGMDGVRLHAESAKSLFKRGQAAEAREDYDTAYEDYQKANSMAPSDLEYRAALYRVRISASSLHAMKGRKLMQSGDEQGALMELLRAVEIDPGNEAAQQEIARIRANHGEKPAPNEIGPPETPGEQAEIDSMAAPVQLKPLSKEPLTLHMAQDSKVVYQAVGEAAGVNVLFDPEYTGRRIQVDLNSVSLMDALRIVATLSNTFWRPVTPNTIFVAANTRAKRTELEEQAIQTFYLTNAWQQNDLNDVQTAIRNVLPNTHVYGVQSQEAIVMRGTPDELLLAQKLINDLDKARPEVVVDIAVLEVSKNWQRTLGIAWPSSAGIQLQSPTASSSTTCPTGSTNCTPTTGTSPTLYNLAHLNSTDFAVTIGAATANLLLSDSNTKVLQNPRIRATDQQKATMKIGQRIPIATGSFQSGIGVAAGVSPLAETQFQYQDVGVNIEMTPTIHYDHEVTLKMKIDVSSVAGQQNISGVTEPIFAQHTSEQVIRLNEGEASILGGILEKQDQVSWTGIPGLSSIPLVKYLFGSKDHTITEDEIVFLVVPHIMRSQDLTPANLRPVDTGAGQAIELRHVSAEVPSHAAAPPATSQARPGVPQPEIGTVQSQSAQAAAPAALAQLNAAAQTNPDIPAPNAQLTLPPPGHLSFSLVPPPASVAVGATFQVPVVITGATDIASVPLQVSYDPAKLSLVNVGDGDFLNRDGQSVALVHRDDGPGTIVLNASRPPGVAGVSGAGVVCVLTFQAKAAGESPIAMSHPAAMTSAQQPVQAQGTQTNVAVK